MKNFTLPQGNKETTTAFLNNDHRMSGSTSLAKTSDKYTLKETTTTFLNSTSMKSNPTKLRGLVLAAMLIVMTTLSYAQTTPTFQCYIDSDYTNTATTYEFNIKVKAVGSAVAFSDFQFGIFVNPSFTSGAGTITPTITSYGGPGDMGTISWDGNNNMIRLSVDTGNSCSTSAFTIGSNPVNVYRILLTSANGFNFGGSCTNAPNLQFNFGNALSGNSTITSSSPWPTRIAFWANCSPVNDSDITALGAFNANSNQANGDSIAYYGGSYTSNVYSGQSPVSPYANNPVGVVYYADVDNDGYMDKTNFTTSCLGTTTIAGGTSTWGTWYYKQILTNSSTSPIGAETQPRAIGDHLWDCNDSCTLCIPSGTNFTGETPANIHPGAQELCNGIDDNCNGVIDGNTAQGDGLTETTFYQDLDGDLFGNPAVDTLSCRGSAPFNDTHFQDGNGISWTVDNTDCNDDPAFAGGGGHIHVAPTAVISSSSGSFELCSSGSPITLHPYVQHTVELPQFNIDDSLSYNQFSNDSSANGYTYIQFAWTPTATTEDISVNSTGTYSVIVTQFGCASAPVSVTITQAGGALSMGTLGSSNVSCYGGSNGTVTAGTISNAVGTVNYLWSNSATTSSITVGAGTYTLTISDNCSSASGTGTVGSPTSGALALGTLGSSNVSCYGGSNGTVTAGTISNAVGTVNYLWSNSATTSSITVGAGTYTLTISDNCSSASGTGTVGSPTSGALALGTLGSSNVSCYGGSNGTVTAGTISNAVGTVNYLWSNSATTSSITVGAGTYTLTISDNCSSASGTGTVGSPTSGALALGTLGSSNVSCYGGSNGTVSAGTISNAVGTVHYLWSNSATTSSITVGAGTYTLTISDNCSSASGTGTVGSPTSGALALGTLGSSNVSCYGGSNGTVTAGTISNAVGTVNYLWSNSATTSSITVGAGTYTLTISDNCSSASGTGTVGSPTSGPLSMGSCSESDATYYGGSDGTVSAGAVSNSVGAVNYSWSNGATIANVSGLAAGTYTLTVTDNCSSVSCTETVGQPGGLSMTSCSHTDVTCNAGSNGTVTSGTVSNAIGTVHYAWSNGATTVNLSGVAAGTYSVAVSDSHFTVTCSQTVNQPSAPLSMGILGSSNVSCYGGSNGTVTAGTISNAVGTVNYLWSNSATTSSITVGAGTYTLTISDNCSSASGTGTVGSPTSGALALGTLGSSNVSCYGGSNGTVTAGTISNAVGTVNYLWSNSATTSSITVGAGTYTLTISDNCSSASGTGTVGSPTSGALALGTLGSSNVSCYGGSNGTVTAGTISNAVGTVNYLWSNSATTSSITVGAGTYTLTISDNCSSASGTGTVGSPTSGALALGTLGSSNVSCYGGSNGTVTAGTISNAVGTVNYLWSNSATTSSITVGAGTYTLTISDNCSSVSPSSP